jgi:hypothetical protein
MLLSICFNDSRCLSKPSGKVDARGTIATTDGVGKQMLLILSLALTKSKRQP